MRGVRTSSWSGHLCLLEYFVIRTVGSHADNVNDKVERGRVPVGDKCPWSKLTDHQICEIRDRHSKGERNADLAVLYSVSRSNISVIVNRKSRVGGIRLRKEKDGTN